jgi:ATP-dependent Clp protease adaptor protein ClpS
MASNDANESATTNQPSSGGTATATRPATAPVRPAIDRLPPWRVLLHNDDVNVIEDVINAIQEICKFNHIEALKRTLEAHQTGVALLFTTHREHAELVKERLESKLLTVSIEPVN